MTTELFCLLLTAILAASLWIPFIVGVNITPAPEEAPSPFIVPPDPLKMKPWIARAYRAHQNLLEQFLPFAVIVMLAHVLDISTAVTEWTCLIFVGLRVTHAVGMITAKTRMPLRPIIFTTSYICILILAWQVFANS